jgi:hypothetical protein
VSKPSLTINAFFTEFLEQSSPIFIPYVPLQVTPSFVVNNPLHGKLRKAGLKIRVKHL